MKGKSFIVTGAFGAIGQAVVAELGAAGARVALIDAAPQLPANLEPKVGEHLVLPGVDLTDFPDTQAAVARVAERFGTVAGLVNIAGGFRWETVKDGDVATWDLMYAVNVKTALHASKAVLPMLLANGWGRIVNIGAAAASKAAVGMGAYAAAKSGVMRLTEALAEEAKAHDVTVNAILPSIVDTPANRKDMPDALFSHWVTPDAIAGTVAFLLSHRADAITGAGIPVTGRL